MNTITTKNWIPSKYLGRAEYLRLYQRNRYHLDEEYRQTQMEKVKARYRLKKLVSKQI